MIIQGPDGAQIEFPDDTPPDVMKSALRKRYGGPPPGPWAKYQAPIQNDRWAAFPDAPPNDPYASFASPADDAAQQRVQSESGTLQNIDNAGRAIARGIPLIGGAMDEISAGLNTGFGYAGDYGKELEYQRERDRQYDEQHPWLSGIGQVAGGIAGTIAGARSVGAPSMPQSLVGKMGMGTVAGGALGAEEGFTRGEGGFDNRRNSAMGSGAIGAAIGGAVPGVGASLGRLATGNISRQIAKGVPSGARQRVSDAVDRMYDTLRNSGIRYDPASYQNLADAVSLGATKSGFRRAQAPMSFDIIDHLNQSRGLAPDFSDLDSLRKATSNILREDSATRTDKELAGRILDSLDGFAEKAPVSNASTMSGPQAAALAKQAREMSRRNIIANDVEEMMRKAETYQSGQAAGLRNQFSTYLRSSRGKRLTPEEYHAFMEVAKGNFTTNVLNTLGRFGFDFSKLGNISSLIPSGAASAAYYGLGPFGAAGVIIGGTAAKYAGRKLTENLAKRAENVVLAGIPRQSAFTSRRALRSRTERLANALLLGQSGHAGAEIYSRALASDPQVQ